MTMRWILTGLMAVILSASCGSVVPSGKSREEATIPSPDAPERSNTAPPGWNVVGKPGVNLPDLGRRRRIPSETPGVQDSGFGLYSGVGVTGIYSGHDAQRDLVIPGGGSQKILYAPTMIPPAAPGSTGAGCLEVVTAHWGPNDSSTTWHANGFWDHCQAGYWILFEFMDASWAQRYIRGFDGEERYFTKIENSGDQWAGYLFNFQGGYWERKVTVYGYGFSIGIQGWTMWEGHFLPAETYCPRMNQPIRSAPVMIRLGGLWQYLSPTYSYRFEYGSCFANGTYRFVTNVPNYNWTVWSQ